MKDSKLCDHINNEKTAWPIALEYHNSPDGHHFTLFHNFSRQTPDAPITFLFRNDDPILNVGIRFGSLEVFSPYCRMRAPIDVRKLPVSKNPNFSVRLVDSNTGQIVKTIEGVFGIVETALLYDMLIRQYECELAQSPGEIAMHAMDNEPSHDGADYHLIRPRFSAMSNCLPESA